MLSSSKGKRKLPVIIKDYYTLIYYPEHPRAQGRGYVPEQVLVAEKHLGRKLSPDEEVKHINGKKKDNRPENLEVISSNSGYKTKSFMDSEYANPRKASSDFVPCKFTQKCWAQVRLPIIKKAKGKIHLPYICSFASLGDVYSCNYFWDFMEKDVEETEKIDSDKE